MRRSESKSGHDKSLRKGGAGPHNWGSVRDELDLEREGLEDAELDEGELGNVPGDVNAAVRPAVDGPPEGADVTQQTMGGDDLEKAREFRAKGLKGDGALSLFRISRCMLIVYHTTSRPDLHRTHLRRRVDFASQGSCARSHPGRRRTSCPSAILETLY